MRSEGLQIGYSFKPYRVCPVCQSKYTIDKKTKKRAALIAVFALVISGLYAVGFWEGFPLGLVAAASGAGLLVFTGYTLSKISYVEYHGKRDS